MREQTTTRTQRLEIRLGTPVIAEGNDDLGKVDRVVASPGTGEVLGIVVRRGLLLRRDTVIPIDLVREADEYAVYVDARVERINELPEYREGEFVRAGAGWRSPEGRGPEGVVFSLPARDVADDLERGRAGQTPGAAGGRPLRAGQRVVCRDGEAGKLDLVLIDGKTGRATHFVVRRGLLFARDTIVPVSWVRDIDRDRIYLDLTRDELNRLPEYRPDFEITEDVLDKLWYGTNDLRPADLEWAWVETHDGIVYLEGHTESVETKRKIEEIARSVPGVLGVENHLDTFEDLREAARESNGSRRPDVHSRSAT
jgi:uncharacterized protein YrrD